MLLAEECAHPGMWILREGEDLSFSEYKCIQEQLCTHYPYAWANCFRQQNKIGSMMSQGSNFLPRINPHVFNYGICRAAWQPHPVHVINQCSSLHVDGFATGFCSFCSIACPRQKRHRVLIAWPKIVNLLTTLIYQL